MARIGERSQVSNKIAFESGLQSVQAVKTSSVIPTENRLTVKKPAVIVPKLEEPVKKPVKIADVPIKEITVVKDEPVKVYKTPVMEEPKAVNQVKASETKPDLVTNINVGSVEPIDRQTLTTVIEPGRVTIEDRQSVSKATRVIRDQVSNTTSRTPDVIDMTAQQESIPQSPQKPSIILIMLGILAAVIGIGYLIKK